jgi:ribonuclease HI
MKHVTEKCTKFIFTLSKSAKLNWGLNQATLKTIYTGGILPLLLYGAPVWANIMDKTCHRQKVARVRRLINIKIAKAYRTVSNEALCILTGLNPISIKIEETAQLNHLIRGSRHKDPFIDHDKNAKHWLHPATKTTILDDNTTDTSSIQIFTDGSKSEHGVGAGFVILNPGYPTLTKKFRLHNRCTNNQAEQLAILKSLEYATTIQIEDKTATVLMDSKTTLDSLNNNSIHTSLIEEIRSKVYDMENKDWKIRFRWIKGHAGTWGN